MRMLANGYVYPRAKVSPPYPPSARRSSELPGNRRSTSVEASHLFGKV